MQKTNLEAFIGDDFSTTVTILDADGAAQDITDWTLFLTIKENPNDADDDAIFKDEYDPTSPASAGIFTPTIASNLTAAIPFKTYYYDMQVKKDDDTICTILKGVFTFNEQITIRTV